MRLCAHLLPFYHRAFPQNRILSIGLAYHTGWRMSVFFRDALPDALQNVPPDGVFIDEQILTEGQILTIPVTAERYP